MPPGSDSRSSPTSATTWPRTWRLSRSRTSSAAGRSSARWSADRFGCRRTGSGATCAKSSMASSTGAASPTVRRASWRGPAGCSSALRVTWSRGPTTSTRSPKGPSRAWTRSASRHVHRSTPLASGSTSKVCSPRPGTPSAPRRPSSPGWVARPTTSRSARPMPRPLRRPNAASPMPLRRYAGSRPSSGACTSGSRVERAACCGGSRSAHQTVEVRRPRRRPTHVSWP